MKNQHIQYLSHCDGEKTAYIQQSGRVDIRGVVFLSGFYSTMQSTKAEAVSQWCYQNHVRYLRFDYFGHGQSSGVFEKGTVRLWCKNVADVIDSLTEGPQILIGSSFGGWMATLFAEENPDKVAGLLLIAPAVEMMTMLSSPERMKILQRDGLYYLPSDPSDIPITQELIEDGQQYLLLDKQVSYTGKVHILQGQKDTSVPWESSLRLAQRITSQNVQLHLFKNGDHRLSDPRQLQFLYQRLEELLH